LNRGKKRQKKKLISILNSVAQNKRKLKKQTTSISAKIELAKSKNKIKRIQYLPTYII
jgi:hypothetical protein